MGRGSLPVLLLALLAPLTGCASEPSLEAPPSWERISPGLEMAAAGAADPGVAGSGALLFLRADPARWRVEPRHYADEGLEGPISLEAWVERTGAPVVFNAGFYYPDARHIGLLVRDGRNIGTGVHPKWKGLLVSDAADGPRKFLDILDLLEIEASADAPAWRSAVQSLMILKNGRKRLRKTDRTASRTACAIDAQGRLVVLWAEGAWSLWNLADLLDRSGLGIRRAMTMDGGREAQLAVETAEGPLRRYGSRGGGPSAGPGVLLPAVVTLVPREE